MTTTLPRIWFTADQHFGHARIIELSHRPFLDVNEMNETLINNWNYLVLPTDEIWVLGDFAFKQFRKFDARLSGIKHYIKGSHDDIPAEFKAVRMEVLRHLPLPGLDKDFSLTLCHYAMRSWDKSHYGTWHLYGHHHGMLPPYGLSFDVGVDSWGYAPVSLEQVAEKMATLKPIVDFSKPKETR
jgi:calcineurin-like phosphoesterase family protein